MIIPLVGCLIVKPPPMQAIRVVRTCRTFEVAEQHLVCDYRYGVTGVTICTLDWRTCDVARSTFGMKKNPYNCYRMCNMPAAKFGDIR
jgi:hypothetical protein